MAKITDEINDTRRARQAEVEDNNAIRKKISERIDEYRKDEADYNKQMEIYQKQMELVEQRFKSLLEGKLGHGIKDVEKIKKEYDQSAQNADDLQGSIKNFMEKFETLKD